jgi:RNA polymerase sigma-70 factor (ECF subfamily)
MAFTGEEETRLAGLMRAALAGDEAAYAEFLKRAAVFVRIVVRRKVGSSSDGEDVVQEALLAIHLKRHTWRIDEPITPWLSAITRYKVIDAFRRRGRRGEVDIEDFEENLEAPAADTGYERDIGRALDSLAPGQRRVVTALTVEGRSVRETAATLGLTENAVRVALHRGLAAIAARFGRT